MYIHSLVGEEKRNSKFFFRVKTVLLTKLILHLIVFKPHVTMQPQRQAGFFFYSNRCLQGTFKVTVFEFLTITTDNS